jgi:hypothetical protein
MLIVLKIDLTGIRHNEPIPYRCRAGESEKKHHFFGIVRRRIESR